MNRRTFLLAAGASACGAMNRSHPPRPARPAAKPPDEAVPRANVDLSLRASQLHANQIAIHGDLLVQVAGGDLRKWNVAKMQRDSEWTLQARHFSFVQDGGLVAFALPSGSHQSALYREGPKGELETYSGPVFRSTQTSVVLPGRAADEIYVTEDDRLTRLKLADGRAEELPGCKHPSPNARNRDQLYSLADGRIVAPDREGGIRIVDPDHFTTHPMPGREPMHLAPASGERLWYSYAPNNSWEFTTLVLARLASPTIPLKQVDVAPGRIVHLASGGGEVVALIAMLRGVGDIRWTIIVIDEQGTERWRTEVPAALAANTTLSSGFVAISEHRVVLAAPDYSLLGWDASNGGRVG